MIHSCGREGTVRTWPRLGHLCELCWGSQSSSLVNGRGRKLLSGDLLYLRQGLALTKEFRKCAQLNLPTSRRGSTTVITSPTLSLGHFLNVGRGKRFQ